MKESVLRVVSFAKVAEHRCFYKLSCCCGNWIDIAVQEARIDCPCCHRKYHIRDQEKALIFTCMDPDVTPRVMTEAEQYPGSSSPMVGEHLQEIKTATEDFHKSIKLGPGTVSPEIARDLVRLRDAILTMSVGLALLLRMHPEAGKNSPDLGPLGKLMFELEAVPKPKKGG